MALGEGMLAVFAVSAIGVNDRGVGFEVERRSFSTS